LPVEASARDLASRQRPPQPPFRIRRIEAEFPRLPRRSVFAEGPGTLPSVPSRLREGKRIGRRASLAPRRARLPSRRREGLGEGKATSDTARGENPPPIPVPPAGEGTPSRQRWKVSAIPLP
jgi:hypothetical protein